MSAPGYAIARDAEAGLDRRRYCPPIRPPFVRGASARASGGEQVVAGRLPYLLPHPAHPRCEVNCGFGAKKRRSLKGRSRPEVV